MSRRTLLVLRWAVFLAACAFLYLRLAEGQGNHAGWGGGVAVLSGRPLGLLGLVAAMVLLNWGIEAAKWRWLVAPVEQVGFARAFTATIAGTALGLVTPNRTGEFAGRVLFLAPENRGPGSFATLLGSMAQFVITLALGGIAFLLLWRGPWGYPGLEGWWGWPLAAVVALAVAGSLALYFHPGLMWRALRRLPWLGRLERGALVLESYRRRDLAVVAGMSAARYAVFCAQYIILLRVFAEIPWPQALMTVPVVYLVSTLVPTMLLSELGVRGSVAVAMFAPLGGPAAMVLLASFGLWLVNLALPALAGALILLVARIRTR